MSENQKEFNEVLSAVLRKACNEMLDRASESLIEQLATAGVFDINDKDSVYALKISIFSVMRNESEDRVMELSKKLPSVLKRLSENETDPQVKKSFTSLKKEIESVVGTTSDSDDKEEFNLSSWKSEKVDA